MSSITIDLPTVEPAIWARLTRIDPPLSEQEANTKCLGEHQIQSDLPLPGQKHAAFNEGKFIRHVVKSQDFPDGISFPINSETFNIGRAKQCDLVIHYNKLISGNHCCIHKDEHGIVWLEDTSTNGTLLNKNKKISREKVKLQNGDVIHLVFKNCAMAENLGFKFERIDVDEEATQQHDSDVLTDDTDTPEKSIKVEEVTRVKKRGLELEENASIAQKKICIETEPKAQVNKDDSDDEIGETLNCIICQDILHDCVSLQPCMHSFCAGCYSEWMATSNECPCCRLKVDRISKNHLVNNLVDSYLKKNPNKMRSEDELKELDSKNKITLDMLYKKQSEHSESEDGSPHSSRGSSDSSLSLTPIAPTFMNFNPVFARNIMTFGPPRTVCRQCPENSMRPDPNTTSCAAACAAADTKVNSIATGPSAAATATTTADPDAKTNPQAPDYVCIANQNHVLCMCCLQPMPDRRQDRIRDESIPKQQCSVCFRSFCHAYWTCPKADCLGCLGKFRQMNFGRKCLASIVLENQYESDVLRDYLDSNDISVRQLLDVCITKLVASEYSTTDSNRGVLNADTFICYPCGLRNFRELAYFYRKDIANADLPEAVTRRENCYWGKDCRTQKHKPHHAARLNHVCEATRTRP